MFIIINNKMSTFDCLPNDSTCEMSYIISIVVVVIIFGLLGYFYPIKDTSGVKNKALSVFLSIFIFPLYIIIFTIQFPYVDKDGNENILVSLLVLFFFWPVLFFITDTRDNARVSPKNGQRGDFV